MEFKVTNIADGHHFWIKAESAAHAVKLSEAARQGKPVSAFKASHYSEGPMIDETCGQFACVGHREWVCR